MGTRTILEDSAGDVSRRETLDDYLPIVVNRAATAARIFARPPMAWARQSLEKLPIRMTLGNLGLCAVVLAVLMPRSFTYMLVYPIFRLVFGTLYPAYASYKAVRTRNVKEYVKWMMYWIVFALFTCAETFTDVFLSFWFPFYYEIKIILVLWLLSPATKGSSILYRRFVHPALIRREAEIDEALAKATEQGYTAVLHLGTKGVNYATTVLMQTAIKGGGGLVQQLRKSYSLSDLTGEKEDVNRNTADAHDETDMEEIPRRREHPGRRGYSPRRTQSGSNRVEMYFSEVDVDVRQPRPREPIASLTNIKSSEDISSGYSSGEALHSHRASVQGDALVRTSSVGARTRAKSRPATKKTPEDTPEDSDYNDLSSLDSVPFTSPKTFLTSDRILELLLFLSQSGNDLDDYLKTRRKLSVSKEADKDKAINLTRKESESSEASEEFVDTVPDANTPKINDTDMIGIEENSKEIASESNETEQIVCKVEQTVIEASKAQNEDNSCKKIETTLENAEKISTSVGESSSRVDLEQITSEMCQEKFDELKQLLENAHRAVSSIVSKQEVGPSKFRDAADAEVSFQGSLRDVSSNQIITNENVAETRESTLASPLASDNCERAGKYKKKPAPKVPAVASCEPDEQDFEAENAVKATLVIKTGIVKTVTSSENVKDIFLSRQTDSGKSAKKKSSKSRTKEGFSRLLTIPKNIIHNAFRKDHHDSKAEDSSSNSSGRSRSRSRTSSIDSRDSQNDSGKDKQRNSVAETLPLIVEKDTKDDAMKTDVITSTEAGNVEKDDKKFKDEENIDDKKDTGGVVVSDDSESEESTDKTVIDREGFAKAKAGISKDNASPIADNSGESSANEARLLIRQMSHSPSRGGRNLFSD